MLREGRVQRETSKLPGEAPPHTHPPPHLSCLHGENWQGFTFPSGARLTRKPGIPPSTLGPQHKRVGERGEREPVDLTENYPRGTFKWSLNGK